MIYWPDITFPPINLYSMPKFAREYLELEKEYCNEEYEEFNAEPANTPRKTFLEGLLEEKREEFNRLWNSRAEG